MSIQINSSEVLKHLNNYGITSVDDEALKLFIKDLKKLIKYELRKTSENLSSEPEIHPQKLDTFMPAQSRTSSPSKRSRRCMKKEIPNVYPFVLCRCEPYHCGRIVNCNCHLEKQAHQNNQESIPEKTSKSPDVTCVTKQTKEKTVEAKPAKGKEPAEQISRPASHTRSHSGGRSKKLSNDPVELYQYYQSIWKKHTLPGENNHAQLRRSIRDRLMKVK